jgi:hypothetical protein
VANLQGYSFHLISSNGSPAHDLVIQTETFLADGSANFTGTWSGQGPNSHQITNGRIWFDATGKMEMSFSWTNGSNGTNSFLGTLTRVNPFPAAAYYYGAPYHLDGDVTSSTGGGPGHVSGNGAPPPLVYKLV